MSIKRISEVPGGAPALGPYSPGVIANGLYFISGQTPYDPAAGGIVRGSIAEQTSLVLQNLDRTLAAAGCSKADVVSCRVFLQELTSANFQEMNAVFAEYFGESKPARTTVGLQLLNMDVEIEAVAALPDA